MANPEIKRFNWCGHEWVTCMEGGRPIHPDNPWYYIDGSEVVMYRDGSIRLNLAYRPTEITWYNSGWTDKVTYKPTIACGLIRSVEAFPVNNSFECDVMMPIGKNLWFSFWLTACDSWPPEIDIFEGYTDENGSYLDELAFHWRFPFIYRNMRFESNVHYTDKKGVHRQVGPKGIHPKNIRMFPYIYKEWQHFKCIWKEDYITFSVNDIVVRTIRNKKVLEKMKTKGMWAVFNIWPNDKFDLAEEGNIKSYDAPFVIKNFKVNKV